MTDTNEFTLDNLRAVAQKKYASTVIPFGEDNDDSVELVNPIRLDKKKRDQLLALQDALQEDDADQEELLSNALKLVAKDKAAAKRFLAEVDGDLALLATVFEHYSGEVELGEA